MQNNLSLNKRKNLNQSQVFSFFPSFSRHRKGISHYEPQQKQFKFPHPTKNIAIIKNMAIQNSKDFTISNSHNEQKTISCNYY